MYLNTSIVFVGRTYSSNSQLQLRFGQATVKVRAWMSGNQPSQIYNTNVLHEAIHATNLISTLPCNYGVGMQYITLMHMPA